MQDTNCENSSLRVSETLRSRAAVLGEERREMMVLVTKMMTSCHQESII